MSTYAAVVLAAGQGTRMRSQTPKVLHRICGREMVRLVVEAAAEAGLGPIFVVVPHESQAFRDALGDGVGYVEQHEPMGSGHALLSAKPALKDLDNLVVLAGDVPLVRPETIRAMIRLHDEREAHVTLLTAVNDAPDGLGRIVRDRSGGIVAVVEESEADESTLSIKEINGGAYCLRTPWLWPALSGIPPSSTGEVFLTDLIGLAAKDGVAVESVQPEGTDETLGVNTRVELARADRALRDRVRDRWMLAGVTLSNPDSVYIDVGAEIGQDTIVLPNTHIAGESRIGPGCTVGPNTIVSSSVLGAGCRVVASLIEESWLADGVQVGPFSHVRNGARLEDGVRIGSFGEVKNSRLGPGTKSVHFSYIGDADLGANVNIGAGTVTCNYDGKEKHRTVIEDDAFIGSDSMLVAPVTVGARAATGAGSVVTKDVPPDTLAVGVPAKVRRASKSRTRRRPRGRPKSASPD